MQTISRITMKFSIMLLLVAVMFGAGLSPVRPALAACAPTVTLNLYAKTGSATLFGATTVYIWGYSSTSGGAATLPGPVLDVNQGTCVAINLTNNLTENTSLLIQGQGLIPDTTGVAPASSKQYIFTAANAGTYLYEAGLIPGKQHQVALGMYGLLIVRPAAPSQAYNSAATAYDVESPVVLSEIDPALNGSATPATFDMRNYAPKYFLINGKAYPDTASIFAPAAGNKVLLRYVNAGLQSHAMSTLGLTQNVIATDGNLFLHPHAMSAETIAPGQTLDALVTVPASAVAGTQYAMYDANLSLRNTNAAGLGGMLTFLTVGAPPPPVDTGPFVTSLGLSPNPTGGATPSPVTVTATISDLGTLTVNNIAAAEFYIDSTLGTAYPMTADDSTFDESTEAVTSTSPISTLLLQSLASGNHTIYVHGQDSLGNWSSFLSVTLNLDKTGPTTSGLSLSPNPSSGAVPVTLNATGNDTTSGNSNVSAAEYWVDAGVHTAMTPSGVASPTRSFTASIPAGLSMGTHIVSVRSQDSFGNWGAVVTINLQVTDTAAPSTSNVVASPNPNNGSWPFNSSTPAVRVTASFSDVATGNSNIVAAEGFIDTVGSTGTGFAFIATDGIFNSPSESGYSDIPLAVVGTLSQGNHTISVHARDAAGNWGAMSTTVLVINKSLYFSTAGNTNPPGVGGTADDADIYLHNGSAFSRSIDVTAITNPLPGGANVDGFDWVDGTHYYMSFNGSVTVPGIGAVQDEDIVYRNGTTWSLYFDGSVNGITDNVDAISIVGGNLYISLATNTIPPLAGGTGDDADIYRWNGGSSYTRVVDASTIGIPSSGGGNANTDGFVWVDAAHFYMSFTADTTITGLGAVQDEDVVYFNAGAWLIYFDGTGKGLTANNQDIDAFDIP